MKQREARRLRGHQDGHDMDWLAPGWWQKRSKWPGLGYMGGVSRTGFCTGRIWVER